MLKKVLFIACLFYSFEALSCSFGGTEIFEPTMEEWEQHPGPKQKDRNAEGDYWEKVPVPVVNVVSIRRGSKSPGSSCDDAGVLILEISLPDSSTYQLEEFGVYFRVISGSLPDEIFPDIPLIGSIKDGKMSMLLAWLDGHPKYQSPLKLEVEAALVTNSLNLGPATKFKVEAAIGNIRK